MAADIHSLNAQAAGERSVYLDAYLAPFREWLERDTVTEILVNRPGEVWIEDAASPGMQLSPTSSDRRWRQHIC